MHIMQRHTTAANKQATVWIVPAAHAHLSLLLTFFPPLLPDLLLLLGSEHEGHGRSGGLSYWGVKRHRMLHIYGDPVLIDVPAECQGTIETLLNGCSLLYSCACRGT